MSTSAITDVNIGAKKRVVLQFAGQPSLLRGSVRNFDPTHPTVDVYPDSDDANPVSVELARLKAIFFVRSPDADFREHTKKLGESPWLARNLFRVTFKDGEELTGSTMAHDRTGLGFSLYPTDLSSDTLRVFVLNAAVKNVSRLDQPNGSPGSRLFRRKWLIASDHSQRVPLPLWAGVIVAC